MIYTNTLEALTARFRHFDFGMCAALFAEDQEENGLFLVEGQGYFPAVRMENGSTWFYDPEHRPRRLNQAGEDTGPMKTKAPFGERRLLCSDRSAAEMLFVEGEGHAVALISIGVRGVVACGGVNVFQSRTGWAAEELRDLVTGKRVRLAFDPDAAGQRASRDVMRRLLECGATRVATLPPQEDWERGWDIEDWLNSFDTGPAAYREAMQRIGSLTWIDEATQAEADAAEQALPEHHVRTERINLADEDLPAVVVTVFDEDAGRLDLAVIGPEGDEAEAEHDSIRHDAETPEEGSLANGWRVIEAWLHEGERYIPDERGAMLTNIRRRTVILPAPPAEEYGTSESLWDEVKAFIKSWLALKDEDHYDVLVAYVLMTYRIFDAQFPYVPYLRFHGPSGTGKGRALSTMKVLCCWSLDGQPSADNLHRIIEYYGEITLCIDEFHLDRGLSREATERIIDTLNLGNDLQKTKLRCDHAREGGMVVNAYHIYGPKIFAGYGYDEHESLARRTVNIDMAGVDVPMRMDIFALPSDFYKAAYALRKKLMAWRGAKYGLGLPDPRGARARRLHTEAGREVGQIFWPLLEMVPAGMTAAEEAVLKAAVHRRENTLATRGVADESYLLENGFTNRTGLAYPDGNGSLFFPTKEAAEALDVDGAFFARQMKRIGLHHIRKRLGDRADSNPVGGFLLNGSPKEIDIFDRYGVTHPSKVTTTNKGTPL
jgi:hypothetical protein